MNILENEEKIDILSYIVDSLENDISYLETLSLEDDRYNLYRAQLIEMCTTFEDKISELIEDTEIE